MIKKLLIANRGEIVCRIIRTCREMGIQTVAVYSEADKDALFAREADESYHIGPANPVKSYLNIDAIMAVVKQSGSDAVHPGYGFLAESARFANAVKSSGVTWIGPPPQVLKTIESKLNAKIIAKEAGVPGIPGTEFIIKDAEDIREYAAENGLPILLKLDKGGGGKGIEMIRDESKIDEVFERITRIGKAAFDDSDCFIENEVICPRHIEVQFLADRYSDCICLGERECSIQRRHQKIIEESPSPVIKPQDRTILYDYTKSIVEAMGYEGAGTIEYLRAEDGSIYFMEVNARIQVEHPVTEMVTGIDIVRNQLRIGEGYKLELNQDDAEIIGHAIEARIYAEDPTTFAPSPGSITSLRLPPEKNGVLRLDHALENNSVVPPYYDPMLIKVIAWAEERIGAIEVLRSALRDIEIKGVNTTIDSNLIILENKKFIEGDFDVSFIDKEILVRNK